MPSNDLGSLIASRLQSARDDAERIARELAQNGHLSPELATRLTDAVDGAASRARDIVAAALREPRRLFAGPGAGGPPDEAEDVVARLEALERAVVRLEETIAELARGSRGRG